MGGCVGASRCRAGGRRASAAEPEGGPTRPSLRRQGGRRPCPLCRRLVVPPGRGGAYQAELSAAAATRPVSAGCRAGLVLIQRRGGGTSRRRTSRRRRRRRRTITVSCPRRFRCLPLLGPRPFRCSAHSLPAGPRCRAGSRLPLIHNPKPPQPPPFPQRHWTGAAAAGRLDFPGFLRVAGPALLGYQAGRARRAAAGPRGASAAAGGGRGV